MDRCNDTKFIISAPQLIHVLSRWFILVAHLTSSFDIIPLSLLRIWFYSFHEDAHHGRRIREGRKLRD